MAQQTMLATRPSQAGIRLIALIEAGKGSLVLLAGFGLLELVHHDLQHSAESIVRHFHLNPASHYPKIFIDSLTQFDSSYLWLMSAAASAYASLRLIEAWGLWGNGAGPNGWAH